MPGTSHGPHCSPPAHDPGSLQAHWVLPGTIRAGLEGRVAGSLCSPQLTASRNGPAKQLRLQPSPGFALTAPRVRVRSPFLGPRSRAPSTSATAGNSAPGSAASPLSSSPPKPPRRPRSRSRSQPLRRSADHSLACCPTTRRNRHVGQTESAGRNRIRSMQPGENPENEGLTPELSACCASIAGVHRFVAKETGSSPTGAQQTDGSLVPRSGRNV